MTQSKRTRRASTVHAFPPQTIRPDLPAVWQVLDTVPENDVGKQFDLALAVLKLADGRRGVGLTSPADMRKAVTLMTIAFLALAGCCGIPRGDVAAAMPDDGGAA